MPRRLQVPESYQNHQLHPPKPQEPLPYKYQRQPFPAEELAHWKQYGIDAETLNRYGVVSLAEYCGISNSGHTFTLRSSPSEPMFGYVRQSGIKIYRPKSQSRFLFGGNFNGYYCFGLEQLPVAGNTLIITGGEKDVLSLAAHGFPAICFGSETARIPHKQIEELTQRFRNIVLLYDMDATGKKHAPRITAGTSGLQCRPSGTSAARNQTGKGYIRLLPSGTHGNRISQADAPPEGTAIYTAQKRKNH